MPDHVSSTGNALATLSDDVIQVRVSFSTPLGGFSRSSDNRTYLLLKFCEPSVAFHFMQAQVARKRKKSN